MHDTNIRTVSKLLRRSNGTAEGKLSVFLTDYMLHAKLLMNEKHILTGSCNITQKSLNRLGELCIFADNGDNPFARQVRASAEGLFRNAVQIGGRDRIRFNHLMAAAEAMLMR